MALIFQHAGCDLRLVRATIAQLVEVRILEYQEGGLHLEASSEFWQQYYFDMYRRYEQMKFMDRGEAESLARRLLADTPFLQGVYVLSASEEAGDEPSPYPEGTYLCQIVLKGQDFTEYTGILNEEHWQAQLPPLEQAARRRAESQEGK